jgi:hypothetical protein
MNQAGNSFVIEKFLAFIGNPVYMILSYLMCIEVGFWLPALPPTAFELRVARSLG